MVVFAAYYGSFVYLLPLAVDYFKAVCTLSLVIYIVGSFEVLYYAGELRGVLGCVTAEI